MRQGLTLIELLVVLALVAIIIALSAPAFGNMIARQRVRSYNDGLVIDISYARSEAVGRRQPVRMAFGTHADGDCYAIYVGDPGACTCSSCAPGATQLKRQLLPTGDGVQLTSAANGPLHEVTFDAVQAAPDVATHYDITLAHARGAQLRSRIGALGQVHVCSPNGSISGVPSPCP